MDGWLVGSPAGGWWWCVMCNIYSFLIGGGMKTMNVHFYHPFFRFEIRRWLASPFWIR